MTWPASQTFPVVGITGRSDISAQDERHCQLQNGLLGDSLNVVFFLGTRAWLCSRFRGAQRYVVGVARGRGLTEPVVMPGPAAD